MRSSTRFKLARDSTISFKISSFLFLAPSILSSAYLIATDVGFCAILAAVSETGIKPISSYGVLPNISNSPFCSLNLLKETAS
jgi:hypothetical protein